MTDKTRINGLYIEITDQCNLACSYCCRNCNNQKNHHIDFSLIEKILKDSAELGATTVAISGGEPLLHPEISNIVTCVRKLNYKATLLTNGILLSEIDPDLLYQFDNIQISLDGGTQSTNDRTRGTGSYNKVICGIERIVNLGYRPRLLALKMTITAQNFHEVQHLADLANSFGITTIGYSFLFYEGRAKGLQEAFLTDKQKLEVLETLKKIGLKYPDMMISPPGYTEECPLLSQPLSLSPRIDADGNVYVCQMFDKGYSIGNLKKESIQEILLGAKFESLIGLTKYRKDFMNECQNCILKSTCKKGCPGIALHSGNLFDTDGMCCLRKKHLKDYLVYELKH